MNPYFCKPHSRPKYYIAQLGPFAHDFSHVFRLSNLITDFTTNFYELMDNIKKKKNDLILVDSMDSYGLEALTLPRKYSSKDDVGAISCVIKDIKKVSDTPIIMLFDSYTQEEEEMVKEYGKAGAKAGVLLNLNTLPGLLIYHIEQDSKEKATLPLFQ